MSNLRAVSIIILCISYATTVSAKQNDASNAEVVRGKMYVIVFGGNALSANKIEYIDPDSEIDLFSAKPQSSAIYGIGAGYQFHNNWRIDINMAYFANFKYNPSFSEVVNGLTLNWTYLQKLRSTTLFANISCDILGAEAWLSPYITGGLGIAANTAGALVADSIENNNPFSSFLLADKITYNLAWNVGGGLSVKISDHIVWDVINYKYYSFGKFSTAPGKAEIHGTAGTIDVTVQTKLSAHAITTQFRIHF